jgi:DNA polymerase-1
MHGAPFDMRVLSKLGVTHTEDIVCTMTAAFLLDENSEVGLKALAVRYLGVAPAEAVPWEKAVTHGFKSDLFYSYARRDAEWTWALWALLGARLRDESLVSLFFDIEMPFQFVLRDLEMNGVLMDLSSLSTLREGLQEEIIALRLAAYKAGGIEYT